MDRETIVRAILFYRLRPDVWFGLLTLLVALRPSALVRAYQQLHEGMPYEEALRILAEAQRRDPSIQGSFQIGATREWGDRTHVLRVTFRDSTPAERAAAGIVIESQSSDGAPPRESYLPGPPWRVFQWQFGRADPRPWWQGVYDWLRSRL
jgi:hypothetical protein